jgi:hypothetical protein
MSGSRPKPANVEESRGALLGRERGFGIEGVVDTSIRGLDVNREEMICEW